MTTTTLQLYGHSFQVRHNLEGLGYDIHLALKGFLMVRKTHTAEAFCKYIKNADIRFYCIKL